MKKIFTLLLSVVSLGSVFAQSGRGSQDDHRFEESRNQPGYSSKDQRNGDYGYAMNDRHDNNSSFSREKIFRMEKINREYDNRIYAVKNDRRLRFNEKKRIVSRLEMERATKIREVNAYYNNDSYGDNHYDRGNNRNH